MDLLTAKFPYLAQGSGPHDCSVVSSSDQQKLDEYLFGDYITSPQCERRHQQAASPDAQPTIPPLLLGELSNSISPQHQTTRSVTNPLFNTSPLLSSPELQHPAPRGTRSRSRSWSQHEAPQIVENQELRRMLQSVPQLS